MAAAAVVLILISVYFSSRQGQAPVDTYEDPQLAYAETKKILMQVSGNLNEGVEELSTMKEINNGLENLGSIRSFDEGLNNMRKISVLDKSKDQITQKKQ